MPSNQTSGAVVCMTATPSLGHGRILYMLVMSADLIFLYDQILEGVARLTSIATSPIIESEAEGDFGDDVEHVTELLSKRDLLVLAATLRNFAEATNTIAQMKGSQEHLRELFLSAGPPYHRPSKTTINLHQALSRILHAHQVRLLREQHDFLHEIFRYDFDGFFRILKAEEGNRVVPLEPLIYLVTAQDGNCLIRLRGLIAMVTGYLNGVIERLDAEKIFLSRNLRDI